MATQDLRYQRRIKRPRTWPPSPDDRRAWACLHRRLLQLVSLDTASPEPRPPIAIDQEYADGLSVEQLSEPIILLHVGESEGLVSLREDVPEPHYVVSNGNHRLLAAKRLRAILRAYVLDIIGFKQS
jgi:hypothetical protein